MVHLAYRDEGGELELVPGTLRGYRCWRWNLWTELLVSMGWSYIWPQGPQPDARCMHQPDVIIAAGSIVITSLSHSSPVKWCTCGYYASYEPRGYVQHTGLDGINGIVNGAISAHGRIVLGTQGFRAQRVTIDALWGKGGAQDAGVHYGVPWFETQDEMLEKFPPSNVTELIGKPLLLDELSNPVNP